MKDELDNRGNQYEILDFVWAQTKAVVGIESLPPTESVLKEDVLERERRYLLPCTYIKFPNKSY